MLALSVPTALRPGVVHTRFGPANLGRICVPTHRRSPWPSARAPTSDGGPSGTCAMSVATMSAPPACDQVLSSSEIWPAVIHRYSSAQQNGASTQTETQTELWKDSTTGLTWVIRLAAALGAKPTAPTNPGQQDKEAKKPWRNPFLPPEPELTVGYLSDTHVLVLNKFNVVSHHCLVITRTFQSQSDPLNAQDLAATWRLLKAMPTGGLAFFNCGPNSGRSQPHKHLQVVPLPFDPALPSQPPIQPALQAAAAAAEAGPLQPFPVTTLPWCCYAASLPAHPSPDQLETACNALLSRCTAASTTPSPAQPASAEQSDSAATDQPSYNVLLTTEWLVMVPRSQECDGPLAINSLGFAGTILVRNQEGADYVKQKGPSGILTKVGCEWSEPKPGL